MHQPIEKRLRNHFPIIFNQTNSVDPQEYHKEFKTFIDDAISTSSPFLSSEATRYQSILLYTSLVFAALFFLDIKHFKIVDLEIAVSSKMFFIYSLFIILICVAFFSKAWIDYKRWNLMREKNSYSTGKLSELINLGLLRKNIELHYWGKTFDMIGERYQVYNAALDRVMTRTKMVPMRSSASFINIEDIEKIPELTPIIEAKDEWLHDLDSVLNEASTAFQAECEPIFIHHEEVKNDPFPFGANNSYDMIRAAYEKTLEPWLIARNNLTDEWCSRSFRVDTSSQESQMFEGLLNVHKQLKYMRFMYISVEIILPIAFALSIAAYVYISYQQGLSPP
ncbi:hypothetical protein [Pseudomonas botevensis]|uniref:hypothetical protein n=1 Tax=Pseudomonas botevensis TaxID=2842352 RepID=UPI001C3D9D03|nr:hypothetical protein [Pseudomonas botevensis]MBV4478152.1 hypothetical protein [Pseudomonas botevensis]